VRRKPGPPAWVFLFYSVQFALLGWAFPCGPRFALYLFFRCASKKDAAPIANANARSSALLAHLDDLKIFYVPAVDLETQHRPHLVEPADACRAWIHVQQSKLFVEHDLQDMRVPADEQLWRIHRDFLPDRLVVFPGIAADVRDPDVDAFANEPVVQRKLEPRLVVIDIAIDRAKRLYLFQGIGHRQIADIAGMPDLVGLGRIGKYPVVNM
jgi:hypothetical protein